LACDTNCAASSAVAIVCFEIYTLAVTYILACGAVNLAGAIITPLSITTDIAAATTVFKISFEIYTNA